MSDTDRSTVTRRRALQTGSLAGIMAGLLGTTTARAVAAADTVPAVRVVNFPDLTDEVRACFEAHEAVVAVRRAAADAFEEQYGEAAYDAMIRFVEGPNNAMHGAWEELVLAEMARHLPGVAPAMRMVWQHIYETRLDNFGRCCVPEVEA